jgi:hypothetical protein
MMQGVQFGNLGREAQPLGQATRDLPLNKGARP